MAEPLLKQSPYCEVPDISHLITEDDEPLDHFFSEKQQRLLVEPLYSFWKPGRPFIAAAAEQLAAQLRALGVEPALSR